MWYKCWGRMSLKTLFLNYICRGQWSGDIIVCKSDVIMDFTFFGLPRPSVKCMKDDLELTDSDHVSINCDFYNLKIVIKGAKRSDTGKYKIFVTNDLGSKETSVDVLIYGKERRVCLNQ